MQPKHHHRGSQLNPAMPDTSNVFPEDGLDRDGIVRDPPLSGKTEMEHTAGQPDKWPQRPDVPVKKSETQVHGLLPPILS